MTPEIVGAVVLAALALGAVVALRRRTAKPPAAGVAVRVECPEDKKIADVRIGRTSEGDLAVLWCDRVPNRPIGCRQACFIVLPSGNGGAEQAGRN